MDKPPLPPAPPSGNTHTNDERTMAALAHASTLLNFAAGGIGGLIAAAIIWATQKEKSQWVAFHALQSLAFQGAQLVAFIIVVIVPWICGFVISFITFGFGTIIAVPVMILLMFVGLAIFGAGLVYSLYGAYEIYQGREFRYKWVGDWVGRQMNNPPTTPTSTPSAVP